MRIQFGDFALDSETRQLRSEGRDLRLSPKAFDLLCLLAERRPRVVPKADLHTRIWPDTFVVEANLNVLIGEIRQALGDTPRESRFIRTVHKVGYAFCAEATGDGPPEASPTGPEGSIGATGAHSGPAAAPSESGRCWLVWNEQTFVLAAGENIIGRDPACSVWLDASGVSRRHARIQVEDGKAWLDDLGSTNGTFLSGLQLTSRTALKHADVIQVGPVDLTFRLWSANTLKKTARIRRR